MFGGENPFSNIHNDILNAQPEDDTSKQNLIEEIKSRARAAVGRKNWPEAECLYTKGIEVHPDAILYSNRALVRINLNKSEEALDDAEKAIAADSAYAKAFYRKGQALHKQGRYGEALHAFEAGEALAPDDKSFKQMVQKMTKEVKEKGPNIQEAKAPSSTPPSSSRKTVSPSASPASTKKKVKEEVEQVEADDDEDLKDVRGYKRTADGRTTTYFNNELTEETKALIGDIAPKKVEAPVGMQVMEGASSWNQAGTWEERDMTGWANDKLSELLVPVEFALPDSLGTVKTTELKKLEGDCSITMSRGKRRFLFEYAFDLHWDLELAGMEKATGKIHFPDMSSDCNGDYETQLQVQKSSSESRSLIDQFIRSADRGLQPKLFEQLQSFVQEFHSK
mmetsp:Transcript_10674/g.13854  ORF Transcript_10674/g.13854 Transcript_10674/m.13854 type:complete len:394 (+) Transcript_10674:293-1474(+)|eukprot:CAMPEP_0117746776 /NCGR_PEP_ID=MMETSP0947-20121206/8139_1 /TAXON_ID=44440 /ORGANISM="Chattonella subsalsa, Strain CCMP2191" /LENGTH=393 /DNA_ID=CAMNT_0005564147 /DNA_START=223 /DNA_END=1404 /DNA_ORIENTATION=-